MEDNVKTYSDAILNLIEVAVGDDHGFANSDELAEEFDNICDGIAGSPIDVPKEIYTEVLIAVAEGLEI